LTHQTQSQTISIKLRGNRLRCNVDCFVYYLPAIVLGIALLGDNQGGAMTEEKRMDERGGEGEERSLTCLFIRPGASLLYPVTNHR
jgi:hypothetical protein